MVRKNIAGRKDLSLGFLKWYYCFSAKNVHEKITHFWLAENESILIEHESSKVLTLVQNCDTGAHYKQRAHAFKISPLQQFYCLWKMYSYLLTPKCTRNRVITFINMRSNFD